MTEVATYDIVVRGGDVGAQQFDRVAKSAQKLNDTGKVGAKVFADHGDALDKVGRALSSVSPQFARFANVIDDTGKAVMALTSGIGFGTAGLIAGGVIGALALWGQYTEEQTRKLEEMEQATKDAAKAALTLEERISNIGKQRSAEQLRRRIYSGKASSIEIAGEIERLQAERPSQPLSGDTPEARALGREAYASQQQIFNQNIEDLKRREKEAAEREARELADKDKKKGGADGGLSAAGLQLDQVRNAGEARKQLYQDQLGDAQEALREMSRVEQDAHKANLEIAKMAIDEEHEHWKAARSERMELYRQQQEEYERAEKAAADQSELRRKMTREGINMLGNATSTALSRVAKGQKVQTGAVLEGIGDQAIASGTMHILEGIAKVAGGNYGAAAEIGAGGALVAFGMGLSGAGSRMSGGSMSSSGASASAGTGMGYAAEPTRRTEAQPTTTTSTIIVQVNANVVSDEAGETIIRSIEQAERVRGRKLSRKAVEAA